MGRLLAVQVHNFIPGHLYFEIDSNQNVGIDSSIESG